MIKNTSAKHWNGKVEIGEIVGVGRTEDDVETLNEESW